MVVQVDGTTTARTHLVAMPLPGRGHINPMLNLCELLLSASPTTTRITFVVTEEWLGILTDGSGEPRRHPGLELRPIPNVLPSEHTRGANYDAFTRAVLTKMEAPFDDLLGSLDPPPTAVLADAYLVWAFAVARRRGVPAYSFCPFSASILSILVHFPLLGRRGHMLANFDEKESDSLDYIPGIRSLRVAHVYEILMMEQLLRRGLPPSPVVKGVEAVIVNTFYELEPYAVDSLRAELPCPVYAVGSCEKKKDVSDDEENRPPYMSWLDSQPTDSVLYVSLGSFVAVSPEQMDEMAAGLRDSGARFLWVARGESSRVSELSGDGGVVVPWCDQWRVLRHPSVGAFLTHCGWNSVLEGVLAGKPMLTLPLFWDQPADSGLVVNEWRVGLSLKKEGEAGKGLVRREEVAEGVRKIMDVDGDEWKQMRKRASETRENCLGAIKDSAVLPSQVSEIWEMLF